MEVPLKSSWRLWNLLFQLLGYCFVNLIRKRTGKFITLLLWFYYLVQKTPLLQIRGFQPEVCCYVASVIQTNVDTTVCAYTLYNVHCIGRVQFRHEQYVCFSGSMGTFRFPPSLTNFQGQLSLFQINNSSTPLCWLEALPVSFDQYFPDNYSKFV